MLKYMIILLPGGHLSEERLRPTLRLQIASANDFSTWSSASNWQWEQMWLSL